MPHVPQDRPISGPFDQPIFLDRGDLRRRGIKISNSTLLRLEAAGRFPKRIRIADHSVAWLATEIDRHVQTLAAEREGGR